MQGLIASSKASERSRGAASATRRTPSVLRYDPPHMAPPRIIGLTGPNSSGKGETAAILQETFGYSRHSLSDVLRDEARRRGLEPVRDVLIPLGNELRRDHGAGVLATLVLPHLVPPALVDSIRSPAEVAVLRSLPGFVLIAVEAPLPLRFDRSLARARPGDALTMDEFQAKEARENTSDPAAQQLRATAELADVTISNEGTLDQLRARLMAIIGSPPPP